MGTKRWRMIGAIARAIARALAIYSYTSSPPAPKQRRNTIDITRNWFISIGFLPFVG